MPFCLITVKTEKTESLAMERLFIVSDSNRNLLVFWTFHNIKGTCMKIGNVMLLKRYNTLGDVLLYTAHHPVSELFYSILNLQVIIFKD